MGTDPVGHANNPPERIFKRSSTVKLPDGDTLQELLNTQQRFLHRLQEDTEQSRNTVEQVREQVLMMFAEVAELLEHMPWKKHKRDYARPLTGEEQEAVLEEAVDVLHFVFNVFLLLGIDNADHLYRLYVAKNQINHERQDRGY